MFKKIYIEITNICNLKCKFCPETIREKKMMTLEEFEDIIKKVYKHTNLVCLHVKGEPLLHNELENILKILEKYNLKTNITTNGTLIRENVNILKKSKAVRQINFSIHSINQNNSSFNKQYLRDILECVEKLENIIISYRIWNLKDIKDNSKNDNIISELEKFYNIKNLKEKLIKKEYFKIREKIFINQDKKFEWPDLSKKHIIEKGRCLALKEQIAILVDGTVVPCCMDNNADISLGNIFEQELEEIIKNPEVIKIKKNFENGIITCNLCKTCGFLRRLEDKRKNN